MYQDFLHVMVEHHAVHHPVSWVFGHKKVALLAQSILLQRVCRTKLVQMTKERYIVFMLLVLVMFVSKLREEEKREDERVEREQKELARK